MASYRRSLALGFALALGLFAAPAAFAAVDRWTPIGPFGGPIAAVAVHPLAPDIVYAGTVSHGVFRSTDGGQSWRATQAAPPPALRQAVSVALDPRDPRTLYVGAGALFRSTDGGARFSVILGRVIRQVVVAPSQPRTLYAFDAASRIVRSDDGGTTWREIPLPLSPVTLNGLAVDPCSPDTLYAAVNAYFFEGRPGGIYRSADAGASWSRLETGLPQAQLLGRQTYSLAVAPDRPEILYASTTADEPGVWPLARSTDAGATWTLPDGPGGEVLLALPGGRVMTERAASTDFGATWTPGERPTARVAALAASPLRPDQVLLGSAYRGIFRSLDGGSSFVPSSRGITATWIEHLAVAAEGTLYAGTIGALYAGHAATADWQPLSPPGGLPGDDFLYVNALAAHPRRPGLLYIGVPGRLRQRLVRSDNAGASWTDLGGFATVDGLAFEPAAPATVYLSVSDVVPCQAFKSTDRGVTRTCLPLPRASNLEVDPIDSRNVYAITDPGSGSRLAKSTDRGATWAFVGDLGSSLSPGQLVHAPRASGTLYFADPAGFVFRTTDGGRHWRPAQGNLPLNRDISLAVDPRNPDVVYAALARTGVYRSRDGGRRWQPLPRLTAAGIESFSPFHIPLVLDPRDPDTLYLGTATSGVYAITLTH